MPQQYPISNYTHNDPHHQHHRHQQQQYFNEYDEDFSDGKGGVHSEDRDDSVVGVSRSGRRVTKPKTYSEEGKYLSLPSTLYTTIDMSITMNSFL